MMSMNEKHVCSEKTADHLYRIGLFAQMNHTSVKALRFYEEQGLLLPAKIDGESGYRYYTMRQMQTLHRILALKEAGFTIEDMKRLDAAGDERSFLLRKKNAILEKIAELTLQLSKIDGYLLPGGNSLSAPVMVKTIPETVCAVMRRRIDSYDALFEIMPEMGGYMEEAGCTCALPEYCFTQYLEPGFQEAQILVEVCESVTEKKADRGCLQFRTIPETRAACIYHKGSYRDFPKTYEVILRYIEENGYEICGNIRESYIDGVWNKDSEDEWLSEIQIPVVKKCE